MPKSISRTWRRASLATYRESILAAVREVDGAIDLATARLNRGLTDYLNVVDPKRQFYEIERHDVSAQTATTPTVPIVEYFDYTCRTRAALP